MSYAIIFHDIDVALKGSTGDVLHWIAWNIPASAGGIPEGSVPTGAVAGQEHHRTEPYFGPARRRVRAITTTCSSCTR